MYSLDPKFSVAVPADQAQCDVRLDVVCAQVPDAQAMPYYQARLEHLALVGGHGGFECAADEGPQPFVELAPAPASGPASLAWTLHTEAVGAGFWRALLGVLCVADATFPSDAIRLMPAGVQARRGRVMDAHAILKSEVARLPAVLPFKVIYEEPSRPESDRLVRLRFADAMSGDLAQEAIACITSWNEILWGAFPEDGKGPLDCGTDAINAYAVGPSTVELAIANFIASEESFRVVVGMACWFHTMRSPVLQVEIQ